MSIRLVTLLALDGWTDGQNWQSNIALYIHHMLTRDKK